MRERGCTGQGGELLDLKASDLTLGGGSAQWVDVGHSCGMSVSTDSHSTTPPPCQITGPIFLTLHICF